MHVWRRPPYLSHLCLVLQPLRPILYFHTWTGFSCNKRRHSHFLCLTNRKVTVHSHQIQHRNTYSILALGVVTFQSMSQIRSSYIYIRSGDRTPVAARFSVPVQTRPGAHPASYTMGTGSFPGVKRPGRGVEHPPPCSAEVEGRVELYHYSPSGPSWPVIGWPLLYLYYERTLTSLRRQRSMT